MIIEKDMTNACSRNGKIENVSVGEIADVQDAMKQLIVDSCIHQPKHSLSFHSDCRYGSYPSR